MSVCRWGLHWNTLDQVPFEQGFEDDGTGASLQIELGRQGQDGALPVSSRTANSPSTFSDRLIGAVSSKNHVPAIKTSQKR